MQVFKLKMLEILNESGNLADFCRDKKLDYDVVRRLDGRKRLNGEKQRATAMFLTSKCFAEWTETEKETA